MSITIFDESSIELLKALKIPALVIVHQDKTSIFFSKEELDNFVFSMLFDGTLCPEETSRIEESEIAQRIPDKLSEVFDTLVNKIDTFFLLEAVFMPKRKLQAIADQMRERVRVEHYADNCRALLLHLDEETTIPIPTKYYGLSSMIELAEMKMFTLLEIAILLKIICTNIQHITNQDLLDAIAKGEGKFSEIN